MVFFAPRWWFFNCEWQFLWKTSIASDKPIHPGNSALVYSWIKVHQFFDNFWKTDQSITPKMLSQFWWTHEKIWWLDLKQSQQHPHLPTVQSFFLMKPLFSFWANWISSINCCLGKLNHFWNLFMKRGTLPKVAQAT